MAPPDPFLPPQPFSAEPRRDFGGVALGDPVFEAGWWYRIEGATTESFFPAPDSQTYASATATFTWADVTGAGDFSAVETNTVANGGGPSGSVTLELTITNTKASDLTLNIYHMLDADVANSPGGDVGTLTNPNDYITITDGGDGISRRLRSRSIPETPGIRRSVSTTSGGWSRTWARASSAELTVST